MAKIFVQADSSQAEARVIFRLANDEQALHDIDAHDYHALTATWFFGGVEDDYSKAKLGYESPIRFCGKTLRHAGHLGAGKRRASIEVNTQARKAKIGITITEQIAERALKIFHMKQPKIQGVFHNGIIEAIKRTKILHAALPYGVNAKYGGRRIFFEKWSDELNRQAFSYIPQRSVSDNTKGAGLRIKKIFKNEVRIACEAHDALLFIIEESLMDDFIPVTKQEFERPIIFENCTLSRPDLIIPCDIEVGYNYGDVIKLSKFKSKLTELKLIEKSVAEEFIPVIGTDTRLDNIIYESMEDKILTAEYGNSTDDIGNE